MLAACMRGGGLCLCCVRSVHLPKEALGGLPERPFWFMHLTYDNMSEREGTQQCLWWDSNLPIFLTLARWLLIYAQSGPLVCVPERNTSPTGGTEASSGAVWDWSSAAPCTDKPPEGRRSALPQCWCWSTLLLLIVLILWCQAFAELGPNCQVHLHKTLQALNELWIKVLVPLRSGCGGKKWMKCPGSLVQ